MKHRVSLWLRILAMILLLGMAGMLLVLAVGESAGGDYSGLFHAGPAMAALALLWLGWRYPTTGGWVSLTLGILAFLRYGLLTGNPLSTAVLIMAVPPAISGVLFLFAGWLAGKGNPNLADPTAPKEPKEIP